MVQTRAMITAKTSSTKSATVTATKSQWTREPYELRPRQARITVTIPITPYALRPRITFQ